MCWWQSCGSELVAVVRQAEGGWVKDFVGWGCCWLSGGSELGAVDRGGEGEWVKE